MEWIESGLREALLKDGRRLLEGLLNQPDLKVAGDAAASGERAYRQRHKMIQTLFGPVKVWRTYYGPVAGGEGRYPLDAVLGLVNGYSPAMVRLMCRAGGRTVFTQASADLWHYAAIRVEGRQIQRMVKRMAPCLQEALDVPSVGALDDPRTTLYVQVDATGVPMIREELRGRPGKQPDGSARTREVKLGCVFTSPPLDEKAEPWRDLDSTSYVASFESAGDFGGRIQREAIRRGIAQANQVVFMGDGAAWIWELAHKHFPDAIPILDFYHAGEHLTALAEALYGKDTPRAQEQSAVWRQRLKEEALDQILSEACADLPHHGPRQQAAQREIAYFDRNRHRMRYATFRKSGFFIGSGVVEAGCKTVVGQRLKQSGMFWSLSGAQNVLSLRCALASNRFDQFWNQHHASQLNLAA